MKITSGKAARALLLAELPEAISSALIDRGEDKNFIVALKTAVKPNYMIPTIWFVLCRSKILLCTNNKRFDIWKELSLSTINEIKAISMYELKIIWNELDQPDLHIQFPNGTDKQWIDDLVENTIKYRSDH